MGRLRHEDTLELEEMRSVYSAKLEEGRDHNMPHGRTSTASGLEER